MTVVIIPPATRQTRPHDANKQANVNQYVRIFWNTTGDICMAAKTEQIGLTEPITIAQATAICGYNRFKLHRRIGSGSLITVVSDGKHYTTRRHLNAMLAADAQKQRDLKNRLNTKTKDGR